MLAILVFLPILACLAILFGAPARLTAIAAATINLVIGLLACCMPKSEVWNFSLTTLEKPAIHLSFSLMDGMSVVMILLSVLVTMAAVLSGKVPAGREKIWYASILLIAAGAIGAFASTDLFYFYAFHELALVPSFLMIGLLGRGDDRREIAWKITIYLGLGSLVLLVGLVWLANLTGTFSIPEMIAAGPVDPSAQKGIALLLLIGFGTLVSLFPFHSWAAPAYASAPAPVSMLHAGVLKKFGLYGLLRLAIPLAPIGLQAWLTPLLILLLGNILWVGLITINQKRLDSMLGNSSVMHMGYIFLAIAALISAPENPLAKSAAILLMFAHGISIALLFGLTDRIERLTGSIDMDDLGGLAKAAPSLALIFGIAAMASIGLPGLANFSGEVLVFLSAFKNYDPMTGLGPVQITCILAIWGVVISAVYMLRAYRRIFQGPSLKSTESVPDLSLTDRIPALLLIIALFAVGLYPNLLLNLLK
ncbi:NADH-quinone oxidoreductase subunit M [Luteolibacter pohnpeiensis]|uniref:NADH-quinone oxidoreductase subunit M n=1 Tax=Luteolibacter pohnpeiensis TaxID=454153 RepID=A0A934S9M3_9BACT|nr:NADH-quinone oxidoreductase subunit M [Luteolibacter pohnpeiensis]MBK1884368.1 NADH-quinone oxidoreductase subunit M [Luteolibacter pohnpeiensis]